MCVIIIADQNRPSRAFLEAAAKQNPHGAGIAYRHGKDNKVHYRKGLDPKPIIALAATVPLPFVIHFRIETNGGISAGLCHPFALGAPNKTEGRTEAAIFHNGTWADWQDYTLRAVTDGQRDKLPSGAWSDSRALAYLAGRYGLEILDLVEDKQRIAILTHDDVIRHGKNWINLAGLWLSNLRGLEQWAPRVPPPVTYSNGHPTPTTGHALSTRTIRLANGDEVDLGLEDTTYNGQPGLRFSKARSTR